MFVALVAADGASAAGGPVVGMDAGTVGATAPGVGDRFLTPPTIGSPARPRTLVMRVSTDGARVENWRFIKGNLTVPIVAYDSSTTGLSADGRTLVLAKPRMGYGRRSSVFQVLDAKTLDPKKTIRLRGDFTLDGVSPDGGRIYLIHYTLRRGAIGRYEVRMYDVLSGELDPRPVIDPREPDEQMNGTPITRVMSADGRWDYTLYAGNSGTPFLHALDTEAGTAHCVDLDALKHVANPMMLRMSAGSDGGLTVTQRGHPLVTIDPATFAVASPSDDASGGFPWTLVLATAVAGLAAVTLFVRSPRRRPATT